LTKQRDSLDELIETAAKRRRSRKATPCPDEQQMVAFYSGLLAEPESETIREHLAECSTCLDLARDVQAFVKVMSGPREPAEVVEPVQPEAPPPARGQAPSEQPGWQKFFSFSLLLRPAVAFSMAAAAIFMLIIALVLLNGVSRLEFEIDQARALAGADKEALQRRFADETARADRLASLLEQEKSQRDDLEKKIAALNTNRGRNEVPDVRGPLVSFVITAGSLRELDGANRFVIPRGANLVKLSVHLDQPTYTSYRVELRTVDGDLVLEQTGIKPQKTRSGETVSLEVPANLFTRKDHVLKLNGRTGQGRFEEAGQYAFRVVRE
jgi:hypothetical protein